MNLFGRINFSKIRKETIKKLKEKRYSINEDLPLLESNIDIKSRKQLMNRIEILHLLYTISIEGVESKDFFFNIIKEKGLDNSLSDNEKQFLENDKHFNQNLIDISWYKESILGLLWCSGIVNEIDDIKEINIGDLYHLLPPEISDMKFKESIKIRSEKEIIKMLDYYYNLHWSFKHSKEFDSNKTSVIYERRKSLEWCLYINDWDDIHLDT